MFIFQKTTKPFLIFSFVFDFKQAKDHILFQMKPLKLLNNNFLYAHFKATVQVFGGLLQNEKATKRHEVLELGSYNYLAQYRKCHNFFLSKITPFYYSILNLTLKGIFQKYPPLHCTVGWSDLALFVIFEKLHLSADKLYF